MARPPHRRGPLSRRDVLAAGLRATLGAAGLSLARPAPRRSRRARPDQPPNIVVILSDNHRADALGIARHPFVRTPAIDRLAREGAWFVNAYCTTPLCSPARASFLTGLYAFRHGVLDNAARSAWREDRTTFLDVLHDAAGYTTAFIGKWHMPGSGLPRLRGVDHFVTFTIHDGQGRYFHCPLVVDGRPEPSRTPYITTELTDRAIAFVDAAGGRPFCVYLSHKAVHHPWEPPPDLADLYASVAVPLPPEANRWTGYTDGQVWGGFLRPLPDAYRAYMATLTAMDREIGRLLDYLARRSLLDRTVVVYTSDNGFLFGEHRRVELRWPFEEALRIPFVIRYPEVVRAPGTIRRQTALNLDLAPTLLALAGVGARPPMDGRSLVPFLERPATPDQRAWLVEYYRDFPHRVPGYRGIHTDRYLYVEYDPPFPPTLHDLRTDPKQMHDLMGTPRAERVVPELRRLLEALERKKRDA